MRIALVNWARIWDGAGFGGGVNGYCQSLALELLQRGHEVVSLFGGTTFVPSPTPDRTSPCFLRRHDDWLGIKVVEVINSPVMAPSIVQYQRPLDEVSSPELEGLVGRFFEWLRPDVVHFHNIEGFSIGCVGAAKAAGARVLFSLHNYHTVCPQVYLMQGHRRVCYDSRGGAACVNCIPTKAPELERRERAEAFGARRPGAAVSERDALLDEYVAAWGGLKHEFSWPVRVIKKIRAIRGLRGRVKEMRADAERSRLPGRAVESAADLEAACLPRASRWDRPHLVTAAAKAAADARKQLLPQFQIDDDRGQTQAILREFDRLARQRIDGAIGSGGGAMSAGASSGSTAEERAAERAPLLNVIQPESVPGASANEFGIRRAAMVKMLSSCDRVLAVSNFVREKFISMGVDPGVIETLPIGSRIGQVVQQSPELVFDPQPFPSEGASVYVEDRDRVRPVRLVFMGYNNYYKGLHLLSEAVEMLTPEYLRRLDLSIYALDGQSIEWVFRRLEPRLAKLTFVHGYSYHDIPWMLGGKDLGVVPSVWWDNAPQTVFECFGCGVPVLGAAVGGIPDFVIDGKNGMLFRGNDSWDLARRLAEAIREPWRLTQMRRSVAMPKGMAEHAAELEVLYRRSE